MTAPKNLTDSAAINYAMSMEFAARFNQDTNQLMQVLGIVSPEVVPAGYKLEQLKVTGAPDETSTAGADGTSGSGYIEGDLVKLSKYTVAPTDLDLKVKLRPYRKVTSAQAITEKGQVNAIVRTDNKLLSDVRSEMVTSFFGFLANGTGTATGKTMQAALINTEAKLQDTLETNKDDGMSLNIIHMVNRTDVADYLGTANITMQTSFGLTYLEYFLGISNVLITNKVPKGTIYATPTENLHMYAVNFAELASAGLPYVISDNGLIGIQHAPVYDHVSVETNVLTGATLFAEITDYIVKGTIAPGA